MSLHLHHSIFGPSSPCHPDHRITMNLLKKKDKHPLSFLEESQKYIFFSISLATKFLVLHDHIPTIVILYPIYIFVQLEPGIHALHFYNISV